MLLLATGFACEKDGNLLTVSRDGVTVTRLTLAEGSGFKSFSEGDELVISVIGHVVSFDANLDGFGHAPVTGQVLRVHASLFVPDAQRGFQEDETVNLCGRRWDFRLPRPIGADPLDVIVVPDMPVGKLRPVARLESKDCGAALSVSTTGRCLRLKLAGDALCLTAEPTAEEDPSALVTEYRFAPRRSLSFGAPFTEGAILQRDMSVPVWGRAVSGRKVKVSFGQQIRTAEADTGGRWRVDLLAMAACKEGCDLVAESGGERAVVRNVRVGEVWLAMGQSNMEVPVCGRSPRFRDAQGAMIAGMMRKDECLRFVHAASYTWSVTPLDDASLTWAPVCRDYLTSHLYASAVGVYFGRELYQALDVPVAVIGAYWGGTGIEPWIPQPQSSGDPNLKKGGHAQPGVIYNAELAPIAPYAVRGVVWYQGESNARKPKGYASKMHDLYRGLSKAFANPGLAFVFAQIAPFDTKGKGDPVTLRLEQAKFAREEPNAKMAVLSDVGNPGDIHPNDKRTVARRFAALALRYWYGFSHLKADSPQVAEATADGDAVRLTFSEGGPMYWYATHSPSNTGFEVCGAEGVWQDAEFINVAKGKFDPPDQVILRSPLVREPVKVRYLFRAPYDGYLYGPGGLPLGCFEIKVK